MPDFPRIGGASAAEVWAYGTRAITDKAGFTISGTKTTLDALQDLAQADILSDATPFVGANIANLDAAISSRSSHAAADIWGVATRDLTDKAGFGLASQEFPFTNPASAVDLPNVQQALSPTGTGREAKVDRIQDFAEEASDTLTATGAEDTIKEITATVNKLHCYIDLSNMASGDSITVRQYMTIKSAGSPVKYAEEVYTDAQSLPMLHVITKPARYGIKITLEQTAGTYKDFDWETFQEKAV